MRVEVIFVWPNPRSKHFNSRYRSFIRKSPLDNATTFDNAPRSGWIKKWYLKIEEITWKLKISIKTYLLMLTLFRNTIKGASYTRSKGLSQFLCYSFLSWTAPIILGDQSYKKYTQDDHIFLLPSKFTTIFFVLCAQINRREKHTKKSSH